MDVRENLSKEKTGVGFDPLSAASTASAFTLRFLLHPERANRIIQQKSIDDQQLSLEEVLKQLVDQTFGKTYKDGYKQEVQQMINMEVLQHIMSLGASDTAYFQVKYEVNQALNYIGSLLYKDKKSTMAYASEYNKLISAYRTNPKQFKKQAAPKIPDGSPIGMEACSYLDNH